MKPTQQIIVKIEAQIPLNDLTPEQFEHIVSPIIARRHPAWMLFPSNVSILGEDPTTGTHQGYTLTLLFSPQVIDTDLFSPDAASYFLRSTKFNATLAELCVATHNPDGCFVMVLVGFGFRVEATSRIHKQDQPSLN